MSAMAKCSTTGLTPLRAAKSSIRAVSDGLPHIAPLTDFSAIRLKTGICTVGARDPDEHEPAPGSERGDEVGPGEVGVGGRHDEVKRAGRLLHFVAPLGREEPGRAEFPGEVVLVVGRGDGGHLAAKCGEELHREVSEAADPDDRGPHPGLDPELRHRREDGRPRAHQRTGDGRDEGVG